nr:glycosyltransferase [Nocardioides aquaticus]
MEALRAALAALLDDPDRRAAMGRAGRRRVEEHFSWRAAAASLAEVLAGAVAAGPQPTAVRRRSLPRSRSRRTTRAHR